MVNIPFLPAHQHAIPLIRTFSKVRINPSQSEAKMEVSNADEVVWGAAEIAKVINRTPRQTFGLLEAGQLPAKKVGGRWTAVRGQLVRFFADYSATTQG